MKMLACLLLLLTLSIMNTQETDQIGRKMKDDVIETSDNVISMDAEQLEVSGNYKARGAISDNEQQENEPPPGHMKQLGQHAEPIIGEITELDYMIGGKDFYEFFLRQRKPVVFKGITSQWAATKHWKNASYLLQEYSDVLFDVETKKIYRLDLNPRKTMNFEEFLSAYKNESLYLDSPFPQSPMMKDLKLLLMMQCEVLHESFNSMHLLFSNGGTSSPLHVDGYENFLSVFSGTKVVYVIDPKYDDALYMSLAKDFPGLSPISPEAVDFVKYPKFYGVPFHKVVLNAGDVLYIPQGWYHQVRSFESPNIAASMWFHHFTVNLLDVSYRNQSAIEEKFAKTVREAPETIECLDQNINIQSFNEVNFTEIAREKDTRRKQENEFMNKTVLFEEVRLDEPTIFVGSDDKHIYAIDMRNGKIKWKVETAEDTGSMCEFNLDGTLVYCGADDKYMRAIRVRDGTVVWVFKTGDRVIPSALVDSDGDIYFGCLDSYMYALYPNATLKWRIYLQGAIWSSPTQHPTENIVYISSQSSDAAFNMYALSKSTGEAVWKKYGWGGFTSSPKLSVTGRNIFFVSTASVVYCLDSLNGAVVHKIQLDKNASVTASPAIGNDGVVYVLLMTGRLLAVNMAERQVIWNFEVGFGPMGASSSPHIGTDGMLYVGSGNGSTYAINPKDGSIKWKTHVGTEIFFSSPRLSKEGVVYIGSVDGPLHALDSQTGDKIWSTPTDGPLVGTPRITRGFI